LKEQQQLFKAILSAHNGKLAVFRCSPLLSAMSRSPPVSPLQKNHPYTWKRHDSEPTK